MRNKIGRMIDNHNDPEFEVPYPDDDEELFAKELEMFGKLEIEIDRRDWLEEVGEDIKKDLEEANDECAGS